MKQNFDLKVIKNTGFMKGLFSAEELDAAYIKASKENKIAFLNKLIVAVGKSERLRKFLQILIRFW